ncbi:hypothetical protein THF1C08_30257 [Vibrio jasicida]|uniref:Uncharacterized protein n=1 Tax=Vibrio jasicida TaxID=766224 RepID=A0AAU9QTG9_9VIBR|nr:hypothetical protein THF1C08_30257 [Vibrio jasicida]CAH1599521.1 hypothetical protein THF1A12_40177 [Vibrio jasicida]
MLHGLASIKAHPATDVFYQAILFHLNLSSFVFGLNFNESTVPFRDFFIMSGLGWFSLQSDET